MRIQPRKWHGQSRGHWILARTKKFKFIKMQNKNYLPGQGFELPTLSLKASANAIHHTRPWVGFLFGRF